MQTDHGQEHEGRDQYGTVTPFPIPARIPVFPLPNVVLFPKTYLPLHIFEPRYRAMVSDVAMNGQCIGMALLKEGWETDYYGHRDIRSEEHTSELQSRSDLVCRLLLEKKNTT